MCQFLVSVLCNKITQARVQNNIMRLVAKHTENLEFRNGRLIETWVPGISTDGHHRKIVILKI